MSRDHSPTSTIEHLRRRAHFINQIRQFFESRGFFHVETPLLSHDTVVDRHLHPIRVAAAEIHPGRADAPPLFLQTSPEFGMKRLLAAGADSIYQIGKAFRGGEIGSRHNPEFTILEWYRVGDDYAAGRRLLGEFASTLLGRPAAEEISYRALFQQRLKVDPDTAEIRHLRECCEACGMELSTSSREETDRDEWLNLLMGQILEPELGREAPCIVYDWPPSQAALAQIRSGPSPVAERFELFVDGVELANGYHELRDAEELLRRNREVNRQRQSDGAPLLPETNRLVEAMQAGLPPCCGVAVGVDRLWMVASGSETIAEVIPFPFERA